jgi:hypothetical protein
VLNTAMLAHVGSQHRCARGKHQGKRPKLVFCNVFLSHGLKAVLSWLKPGLPAQVGWKRTPVNVQIARAILDVLRSALP